MDKSEVLARLGQDNPLFHYMGDDEVRRATPAGYTLGVGEVSFGVGPNVLRWIADRLTGDMITFETGAGLSTVLFATLARHTTVARLRGARQIKSEITSNGSRFHLRR